MLWPMDSGWWHATEADVIAYCIWFNVLADVIAIYCGRCYYHFSSVLFLADVIANVFVADVIATKADVIAYKWYFGWCYCQLVADVITTILNVLADGIAKWQMELPL